jgi:hypothetical protein
MIGDHTKTAIGTRLMTGSYIGYCCLLAGSAMPPKYVPSFTFLTDKGTEKYRLAKAREVMSQVLGRRARTWSAHEQEMLDYVAATASDIEERRAAERKSKKRKLPRRAARPAKVSHRKTRKRA